MICALICQDIVETAEPTLTTIAQQISDFAQLVGKEISRLDARIDGLNKEQKGDDGGSTEQVAEKSASVPAYTKLLDPYAATKRMLNESIEHAITFYKS